jgi:hypothetical protein
MGRKIKADKLHLQGWIKKVGKKKAVNNNFKYMFRLLQRGVFCPYVQWTRTQKIQRSQKEN